jgi:hypothetical protein
MKKITLLITAYAIFSGTLIFAGKSATTKTLVSSHVEFVQTSIDKKCEKLTKKMSKLEDRLNTNDYQDDKQRMKLINKIQRCKEQIHHLEHLKLSTETIDYNAI